MSAAQLITTELRRWIVEQAQAGHTPEQVLAAMRASGWAEDVAVRAMNESLNAHMKSSAESGQLPATARVPEPALAAETPTLWAGDREVQVLLTLNQPRVVVLGQLLSDDECDAMRAFAGARLARSETVAASSNGSEVNAARTSEGMFFERGENELIRKVEARLAHLFDWPVDHGEGLQVLRYQPGAEYLPHYDYFDPEHPGTPAILKRGGQRVATIVIYLNTPAGGGATIFPDVRLAVSPIKGNAVFFSYDRPHPMTMSLHGGAPVKAGEKWVATKWLREGVFT